MKLGTIFSDGKRHDTYREETDVNMFAIGCSCNADPSNVCEGIAQAIRTGMDTPLVEPELSDGLLLQTFKHAELADKFNPPGYKRGGTILTGVRFKEMQYGLQTAWVSGPGYEVPLGVIDPRSDGRLAIHRMLLQLLYDRYRAATCKSENHLGREYSELSEHLKDPTNVNVLINVFFIVRTGNCVECLVNDLVPDM